MNSTKYTFQCTGNKINENALNFFHEYGFVVLADVLPENEIVKIKKEIINISLFEKEHGIGFFYGANYDENKAYTLQRIWNLLSKGKIFQELIQMDFLLEWMDKIFDRDTIHDKYYLSSFQANILFPSAPAQHLHIDTPFPEPLPPWVVKANSIWAISEFNDKNGATEVVPRSHKIDRKPIRDSKVDMKNKIKVFAQEGSIILTHGALWHNSGKNNSNEIRYGLLGSFAASYVREISTEEDILRSMDRDMVKNIPDKLFRLLGGYHGIKDIHAFKKHYPRKIKSS